MTVAAVSHPPPQYQVPSTPKAKQQDEHTESAATKHKEAATGKEAAVPTTTSGKMNIKA